MNSPKHTPGPWIVEPKQPDTKGVWMHDERGEFVALITGRNQPTEEAANARLIAAAPDMLEALQGLLAVGSFAKHGEQGEAAAQKALASIQKATVPAQPASPA